MDSPIEPGSIPLAKDAPRPALDDLSIVVLSCNRREELRRNLLGLCGARAEAGFELIVVDNDSTDGTREDLRRIAADHPFLKVVLAPRNLGVGGGRNLGWAAATGTFILNLDDDTRIDLPAIRALCAATARFPGAGIFTPRVVHAVSGQCQNGCRDHVSEPANFHGACHLVRARTWREVGPIDDECNFGGEELDYAIRARARGFATVYLPEIRVAHNSLVRSDDDGRLRRLRWVFNYSRVLFKHFPRSQAGVMAARVLASHVVGAATAGHVALVPALIRQAALGARRGRQQYRALPAETLAFYRNTSLEPDFGNQGIGAKLLRRLRRRAGGKAS